MVKWNILANYLGQAWVTLLGLACIPVYIHLLGIEAYGIISFITSLQIILTILDLGITVSLNREFARLNENPLHKSQLGNLLRTVEVIFVLLATLIMIVFIMTRHYGVNIFTSSIYTPEQSKLFIITAGALISLRLIEGMYKSCLVGLQKQIRVNILNIIITSIRHLGAIFLLVVTVAEIETYLYWQIITSVAAIILFSLNLYQQLSERDNVKRFNLNTLKPMWQFSLGVMGMSILSLCLTNIDKLFLVKLVPLREYAEYMLAATVAAGLYSVSGPIIQAVFPRLCELREANKMVVYTNTFHKAAQLICVASTSLSAIILFNAYDILKFWTQEEELAANVSPILSLVIVGTLLNSLTWMPFQCLLSFGKSQIIFKINMVSVIFILPLFFSLVKYFGVNGAALTWLIFNVVYFTLGARIAIKNTISEELTNWFVRDTLLPAFGSFICAYLILYIKWFTLTHWWQALLYFSFCFVTVLMFSIVGASYFRGLILNNILRR